MTTSHWWLGVITHYDAGVPAQPFADACIDGNELDEAQRYVAKMSDPATKLRYLIKTRRWEDAIEIAMKKKDRSMLDLIASKCGSADIRAHIASLSV